MSTVHRGRILRLASGNAMLIAYDAQTPTEAEWLAWLRDYRSRVDELSGLLIYSIGGWPDSAQRGMWLNLMEGRSKLHKTAVVTPSRALRDVAVAFNWFMQEEAQSRVFPPDGFDAACDYLRFDADVRLLFKQAIERHELGQLV